MNGPGGSAPSAQLKTWLVSPSGAQRPVLLCRCPRSCLVSQGTLPCLSSLPFFGYVIIRWMDICQSSIVNCRCDVYRLLDNRVHLADMILRADVSIRTKGAHPEAHPGWQSVYTGRVEVHRDPTAEPKSSYPLPRKLIHILPNFATLRAVQVLLSAARYLVPITTLNPAPLWFSSLELPA